MKTHDPFCEIENCLCQNRIKGLWECGICLGVSGTHIIGKNDVFYHLAVDKNIAVCGKEVDRQTDYIRIQYHLCPLCAKISISEDIIYKFWQKQRGVR